MCQINTDPNRLSFELDAEEYPYFQEVERLSRCISLLAHECYVNYEFFHRLTPSPPYAKVGVKVTGYRQRCLYFGLFFRQLRRSIAQLVERRIPVTDLENMKEFRHFLPISPEVYSWCMDNLDEIKEKNVRVELRPPGPATSALVRLSGPPSRCQELWERHLRSVPSDFNELERAPREPVTAVIGQHFERKSTKVRIVGCEVDTNGVPLDGKPLVLPEEPIPAPVRSAHDGAGVEKRPSDHHDRREHRDKRHPDAYPGGNKRYNDRHNDNRRRNDSRHRDNRTVDTRMPSSSDTRPVDNRRMDNRPVDNRHVDNRPVDNRHVDYRPMDTRHVDNRPVDNRHLDNRPVDNRHLDNRPVDNRHLDNRPLDNRHLDNRHGDNRFVGTRPLDNKPMDSRHVDNRYMDNRPADNRHVGNSHVDIRHMDNRPSDNRHNDSRPVDNRHMDNRAVDNRPGDNRRVDSRRRDNRHVDNRRIDHRRGENIDNRNSDNFNANRNNANYSERRNNERVNDNRTNDIRDNNNPDRRNMDNRPRDMYDPRNSGGQYAVHADSSKWRTNDEQYHEASEHSNKRERCDSYDNYNRDHGHGRWPKRMHYSGQAYVGSDSSAPHLGPIAAPPVPPLPARSTPVIVPTPLPPARRQESANEPASSAPYSSMDEGRRLLGLIKLDPTKPVNDPQFTQDFYQKFPSLVPELQGIVQAANTSTSGARGTDGAQSNT